MLKTVGDWLKHIESRHVATECAEKWDNTGLLVGRASAAVRRGILVSGDLTEAAILLAERRGLGLIINHHPCIFPKAAGLARVTGGENTGGFKSELVLQAIERGIAIAAYHTDFDQSALEVLAEVAGGLGVQPVGRLHDGGASASGGPLLKLVAFVPEGHVEAVRQAVFRAGAGQIGRYDSCAFQVTGEGSFRGGEGSNPAIGTRGELERVREVRLETILPAGLKGRVLSGLLAAHPYEEAAYDFYPMAQAAPTVGLTSGFGYGFFGDFIKPKSFSDLTRGVKSLFDLDGFWTTEAIHGSRKAGSRSTKRQFRRMAFIAGKGASFIPSAVAAGCDVLVTGEVGYHGALEASRRGLTVLELGHRESERFFVSTVVEWIRAAGGNAVAHRAPAQHWST